MNQTSVFFVLTVAVTVSAMACIVSSRSIENARSLARIFYLATAVLSFAALLCILLGVLGIQPKSESYVQFFRILVYRGWLVIGTGIASVVLILARRRLGVILPGRSDAIRSFVASRYLLRGICLSVALSFICTEIGKLAHDAEMRQFFLQSGLPVWFLYFIACAETAGAIGLLIRRTMVPAALGLALIMAGAIGTHLHNRDPFSDSLEALHLLVLLMCIVLLGSLRRERNDSGERTQACS